MILIDPKMLELSVRKASHLLAPVVTDMREAGIVAVVCHRDGQALQAVEQARCAESDQTHNQKIVDARAKGEFIEPLLTPAEPELLDTLLMIVVVIDELADLMMVSSKRLPKS